MYDAVVVGAGPAGNAAAWKLAAAGRKVAVIDWRRDIGDKLCTGIVGPECVGRYPPEREHVYYGAKAATVVSPGERRYRVAREEPQAFVLDRAGYVASFARKAIESGADYRLGCRVTGLAVSGDGVAARMTSESGGGECRAQMAILASGFGSPLAEAVGLRGGRRREYMVGCQAEVEVADPGDTEVYLGGRVAPGSFGWLVPLTGARAFVGVMSSGRLNGHMDVLLSRLRASGRIRGLITQPRRWGIPMRPERKTYSARVLTAGDAAGLVKPTTGGGIYYSLLSGELAAEVTEEALSAGDFSERYLKRYERRWRAGFGGELRVGYHARKLYEALDDRQRERLIELCHEIEQDLIRSGNFSFDWHGRVIVKAITHRELGRLIRSFGPSVAPYIARLAGTRLI